MTKKAEKNKLKKEILEIEIVRFQTLKAVLPLPLIASKDTDLNYTMGYNKALYEIHKNAYKIFKIKLPLYKI